MKNIIQNYLVGLIFTIICVNGLKAQQDPMYSQYMFNMLALNPAYAGSKGALSMTGLYRNQWVGIKGAPVTQTFFAHSPAFTEKVGLGLSLINDKIGPIRQTMLFGDYSYTINITETTRLALGLKAGVNFLKTHFSDLDVIETDETFQDLSIKPQPNFGFGVYYYSDKFFVGFSSPKLIKNTIDQELDYSKLTLRQHYFLSGGYVITLNDQFKLKPTALLKMTGGAPASVEMNASVLYKDRFWMGLGHRFGDSFNTILQFKATNQLSLGYCFEYTMSKLIRYNSGTHEMMLTYDFIFKKDRIISPRYF
ncbi:MAG: type IX secretion system membrane protein PorP/SprF [Bacteroidetes bacterium]|nr:type IX secretion system membrane protein PorP/SprF [Bacteroidota bacterium]